MLKCILLALAFTHLSQTNFLDSGPLDWTCMSWLAGSRNRPSVQDSTFYNLVHNIPSTRNADLHFSLSRHHIIPYKVLYKFFNTVLELGESNSRIHFLLGQFLSNLLVDLMVRAPGAQDQTETEVLQSIRNLFQGFDGAGFGDTVQGEIRTFRLPNFQENIVAFRHLPLTELTNTQLVRNIAQVRIQMTLQSLLTWMPFNYFEGPSGMYRTDEPGPNFEDNAYVIIGEENSVRLHDAYETMIAIDEIRTQHPTIIPLQSIQFVFDNLNVVRGNAPNGYGQFNLGYWEELEPVEKKKGKLECQFKIQTTRPTTTPPPHHNHRPHEEFRRKNKVSSGTNSLDPLCLNTTFEAIKLYTDNLYLASKPGKVPNVHQYICRGIWESYLAAFGISQCLP
ncbi:uncharacterized protein LOC116352557 [Contarinia nasturtii]|uniref:uncharacterized protein LOC116352557 n=1 Tax=Contarinia nasturtii TaxID=265458 RepID=UPI0012D49DC1|nr:uncharacterized protein LOC116352557 [Contarinia nasturtii]